LWYLSQGQKLLCGKGFNVSDFNVFSLKKSQ
jgi:hypothetical protein